MIRSIRTYLRSVHVRTYVRSDCRALRIYQQFAEASCMKSWQRQCRYVRTRLLLQRKDFVRTGTEKHRHPLSIPAVRPAPICCPARYLCTCVRHHVRTYARCSLPRWANALGPLPPRHPPRTPRGHVAMGQLVYARTYVRTYVGERVRTYARAYLRGNTDSRTIQ